MSRCRCCNDILPTVQLSNKKCHFDSDDNIVVLDEFEDMCGNCIGSSYDTFSITSKDYAFSDLEQGIKLPYKSSS